MAKKVDVIVVGAGPVGFLVALELARAGIDASIGFPADEPYPYNLHSVTVATLADQLCGHPMPV